MIPFVSSQQYHGCGCKSGLFCQVAKCLGSFKILSLSSTSSAETSVDKARREFRCCSYADWKMLSPMRNKMCQKGRALLIVFQYKQRLYTIIWPVSNCFPDTMIRGRAVAGGKGCKGLLSTLSVLRFIFSKETFVVKFILEVQKKI